MGWRDNFHSRFVAWMKILLPMAALGMLSTLFLLSEKFDPSETLPYAAIDLQQRAQDQGATEATFAGVTRTGDEVLFQTVKARPSPDDPRQFSAEDVTARFRLPSGTTIDMRSTHAEMNQKESTATLRGDVEFVSSTGYTVNTAEIFARFDNLYAEAPGAISGQAPAGDLTAGRMILQNSAETGEPHLLFTDGVKLLYRPQTEEE
ncbi:MAG: hypothetical protein RIG84_13570 [Roseovarius sp.]